MERKRGWFLTIAAALFALLALSNFLKPILADSHTGFVFFGRRLSGVPNGILGPVFGPYSCRLYDRNLADAPIRAAAWMGLCSLRSSERGAVFHAHHR
jgi:hypothetical protein